MSEYQPAQNIRDVFPTEEDDFTPWLSANLDRLAKPLGLDLSSIGTEARLPNGMELDILARETTRGAPVAIENQYGVSDDDHFSRLLIYAAEFDAQIVIWIAEAFQDKHLKLVQWWNRSTLPDVEVHAVRIVRYGHVGATPVADFEPYAGPQRLGLPEIAIWPPSEGLTDKAKLRRFFEPIKQQLSAAGFAGKGRDLVGDGTDRAFPFMRDGKPLKGVWYCADFRPISPGTDLYERVQAYLYIDAKDCPHERRIHEHLMNAVDEIERELTKQDGAAAFHRASWKSPRGHQRHSIGLKRRARFDDESSWPEEQAWLVESMSRVREVLQPRVEQAINRITGA